MVSVRSASTFHEFLIEDSRPTGFHCYLLVTPNGRGLVHIQLRAVALRL
ncbi:hypothetical protein AB0E55_09590 [Amycolatopsis keratiniphila]